MTNEQLKENGKPLYFDVEKYLDSVEGMINADEVERAFWMLDNLPAYYRDHVPERAKEIRKCLHRQLFTPVQYQGIYDGVDIFNEDEVLKYWTGKAMVIEHLVKEMNECQQKPNIMELAPGALWLPTGLRAKGLKFSYEHKSIDHGINSPFDLPEGDQPNIFVALEIIEHLWHEEEILENYLKFNKTAQTIVLSTPLYTYCGGLNEWHSRPLGHLRTYTPHELLLSAHKMFPNFEWQVFLETSIVILGRVKNEPTN